MADLKKIPAKGEIIFKNDARIETYRRDAVISGNPDAVVRPRDWQEVADIASWCNGNAVPLTVCGARTSMTGSSVAESGVLLTTDNFNKVLDIGTKEGGPYAVVEPGIIAKDFQRAASEKGFHYPVVPTSCDNAFIGGTVSTNATGEDFYKYGPTRSFVREISFIKADGTTGTLERGDRNVPLAEKGHGGYFTSGEEIDKLIGSEGTLAIIKSVTLELLPKIPDTFIILAPFTSAIEALKFIDNTNKNRWNPRAIEYIDPIAISLMKTYPACPNFSDTIKAFVYIKDESFDGKIDALIGKWAERLPAQTLNEAIIATTEKQKEELHQLRHQIPQAISELNEKLQKQGGAKVSGDWWVPKDKMLETMVKVYEEVAPLKIDFTMYAHLGDGHPHTTFICKTHEELARAKKLIKYQAERAVQLGGGVAGEHGIGKIKRDLMQIQYGKDKIAEMKKIKSNYDPKWILGQGNIFKKT